MPPLPFIVRRDLLVFRPCCPCRRFHLPCDAAGKLPHTASQACAGPGEKGRYCLSSFVWPPVHVPVGHEVLLGWLFTIHDGLHRHLQFAGLRCHGAGATDESVGGDLLQMSRVLIFHLPLPHLCEHEIGEAYERRNRPDQSSHVSYSKPPMGLPCIIH